MATELLTRKEASAYLASKGVKIMTSTLEQYATAAKTRGKGPPYYRFGDKGAPTYYKPEELDAWVAGRLRKII